MKTLTTHFMILKEASRFGWLQAQCGDCPGKEAGHATRRISQVQLATTLLIRGELSPDLTEPCHLRGCEAIIIICSSLMRRWTGMGQPSWSPLGCPLRVIRTNPWHRIIVRPRFQTGHPHRLVSAPEASNRRAVCSACQLQRKTESTAQPVRIIPAFSGMYRYIEGSQGRDAMQGSKSTTTRFGQDLAVVGIFCTGGLGRDRHRPGLCWCGGNTGTPESPVEQELLGLRIINITP